MKLLLLRTPLAASRNAKAGDQPALRWGELRSWLSCWEIYPILLIAAVLRFYMINRTEFDGDQATIFHMAHDAVSHGLLVATSNVASIGIVNPPAIIYILMLPAALSADPLWAAVLTALLGTLSVLLTYVLGSRYYGRFAGTIAALFYATAALPVFYSRFIWQQNLLLFFAPLYIYLLFHGAVARRQGWFGPALFLLGLLLQLHGSAFLLVVPLLIALVVAPYTVRWRDVTLGLLLLLFIYAPYILWEVSVHFHDISVLFNTTGRPSKLDVQALLLYHFLLSPYNVLSISSRSFLFPFVPLFTAIWWVMTVLVIGGTLWAIRRVGGQRSMPDQMSEVRKEVVARVRRWWSGLCASPYRCGLSILLSWQIVPLLALLRHSIALYPHYFIMFMPGPFMLAGIFVAEVMMWLRQQRGWAMVGHNALLSLIAMVVIFQTAGAAASVIDLTHGKFVDSNPTLVSLYYNDLNSLQHALSETDQVAQVRQVHHVYIDADEATMDAFRYLATQMHTPTTVFSDACALLPNLAHGPVVLLVGPYSHMMQTLLPRFVRASLVATAEHLGGPPFRVYVLSPVEQSLTVQDTLAPNLQLLSSQSFVLQHAPLLLMRWRFLLSQPPADDALYSYDMIPLSNTTSIVPAHRNKKEQTVRRVTNRVQTVRCALTSVQAGDQLFVSFRLPAGHQVPFKLKVQTSTMRRDEITVRLAGSFQLAFETFRPLHSTQQTLVSSSGRKFISITSWLTQ